jgi:hypothetical protein
MSATKYAAEYAVEQLYFNQGLSEQEIMDATGLSVEFICTVIEDNKYLHQQQMYAVHSHTNN